MNLYRYCGGNPILQSDPTGLMKPWNLTSAGEGDWITGSDGLSDRDRNDHDHTPMGSDHAGGDGAAKSIEARGQLSVDTDGAGSQHGDPTKDSGIPAGVDADGRIVPRYFDDGRENPAVVRPLSADADSFGVAPKGYASVNGGINGVILRIGDRVTATLGDGRVIRSRIGDYGPPNKHGEFSIKALLDHGIRIINGKGMGPMPSLDGRTTPDIPVTSRYYPNSYSDQ